MIVEVSVWGDARLLDGRKLGNSEQSTSASVS